MLVDPQTAGKVADVTTAVAETTGKLLDVASSLGSVVKGPVDEIFGILTDRLRLTRWQQQMAYLDIVKAEMKAKGLAKPTRELPINFAVPLLTAAILEEEEDLQHLWARLLVNAGDAATEMELRTAYVDILKGMSGFDVLNLAKLADAAESVKPGDELGYVITSNLPHSATTLSHSGNRYQDALPATLSKEVAISLANLSRLGCISPTSGFGGGINFSHVLVTELGIALYRACS
jgi:hypothetical protein